MSYPTSNHADGTDEAPESYDYENVSFDKSAVEAAARRYYYKTHGVEPGQGKAAKPQQPAQPSAAAPQQAQEVQWDAPVKSIAELYKKLRAQKLPRALIIQICLATWRVFLGR